MPKTTRTRIDWFPGRAAQTALDTAALQFPHLARQELVDYLVLSGLSALNHEQWHPPVVFGKGRDKWAEPATKQRV